jgi:sec-independent protein translocase protein TatA
VFYSKPWLDVLIVLLVVLLFVGPKRLPGLGRGLGQGMKEFKDGITGKSSAEHDTERPALSPATTSDTPGAAAAPPAAAVPPQSAEVGSSERRS